MTVHVEAVPASEDSAVPAGFGLGRSILEHDDRSWNHRAAVGPHGGPLPEPVTRHWRRPYGPWNQQRTSHCTDYGTKGMLCTSPHVTKLDRVQEDGIVLGRQYQLAQRYFDPWAGEEPSYYGTSTLAILKAYMHLGIITGYEWVFSFDELLRTLAHKSSVVAGTVWPESMFHPDGGGEIHWTPQSRIVSGHLYQLAGVDMRRERIRKIGSWGDWGDNGRAWIGFPLMERLQIIEHGEIAVAYPNPAWDPKAPVAPFPSQ